ncbi:MAG: hypothetical protein IJP70_04250 [Bacteroidales bacterium]|nr:hypothetical protein [Bacteroidales bacterium]
MKRLFLMLSALCTTATLLMAADLPVMYVEYFPIASESYQPFVEEVRNSVIAGIDKTQRFTLVDVASQQSLQIEESRRSSLANMPDSLSRNGLMKQLGAHYILTGYLHTLACEESKFADDVVGYMATLSLSLKIVDTSNGTTVKTQDIKFLGEHGGFGKTADDAVTNLMQHLKKAMVPFIYTGFPVEGIVADTDYQLKKDEMTFCYVTMGKQHGMYNGLKLKAYGCKLIAGEKMFSDKATLTVVEVSDRLCRCRVESGGHFLASEIKVYKKQAALDPNNAQPIVVRPNSKEYVPDNSKAMNKARVGAGGRAVWSILKEASESTTTK